MPQVSDHALLRYLERVRHIDVEAIRADLASAPIDKAVDFGCDTIVRHDCRLKIKGGTVTTFIARRGK